MSDPWASGDRAAGAGEEQYDVVVPDQAAQPRHHLPGGTAQSRSTSTYGWQAAPYQDGPSPGQGRSRGTGGLPAKAWWGIGGLGILALVIVLLVAGGVFTAEDGQRTTNHATGSYAPPSGDRDAVRIIDKESGISYDYLGEGWSDWSQGTMLENVTTVGQYIVTQPDVPTAGQFIAQVTSGLLSPSFGAPGPSGYPQTLAAVEESVRGNYYPAPNEPTNQAERALEIDGHQAYERSMDLTWDVEGYDSTGERVVLLLIDTGKSGPVFFYCSFPNTHAELYPLIEQVIASIKVDQ